MQFVARRNQKYIGGLRAEILEMGALALLPA